MGAGARPLLGVLGGMGPGATVDFLGKLMQLTDAHVDQEHLPVVVYSLPQIPDRSAAILRGAPSPLPAMRGALRVLEQAGARYVAIPCNTAHYWFDELKSLSSVALLSIVDAVIKELQRHRVTGKVALLATEGTVQSGVYRTGLQRAGYELVLPEPHHQEVVSTVIRDVKAGSHADLGGALDEVMQALARAGASACVLGCTELPLLPRPAFAGLLIDSTHALARTCAQTCGVRVREESVA